MIKCKKHNNKHFVILSANNYFTLVVGFSGLWVPTIHKYMTIVSFNRQTANTFLQCNTGYPVCSTYSTVATAGAHTHTQSSEPHQEVFHCHLKASFSICFDFSCLQ